MIHTTEKKWVLSLPFVSCLCLIVLSEVHYGIPGLALFMPLLVLMSVVYWCVFWPETMPRVAVIGIGFAQDMVYGTPFGASAFIYLIVWWVLVEYRKHFIHSTFPALWLSFSGFTILYIGLLAGWYAFYNEHFVLSRLVVLQWVFSTLAYPLVHRLLYAFHTQILKLHA
ncbi:MAG: rod shape-determining protein MreD [Proteobacteria bacterium]|nr:rod shape-determining protein MreD [Pseudomonadota bacterium]